MLKFTLAALIAGTTANAEFLRYHLKRKWKYFFDEKGDCHYFILDEKPWGNLNKIRLNFCLKDKINKYRLLICYTFTSSQ